MTMSFSWTKEQLALKDSMIKLAQSHLNKGLIERDRSSEFNHAGWQRCAEFGILGLPIPEEYGGKGVDPLTTMLALEGLGYGCKDNGLVFAINNHIWSCALSILNFGTEAQKQRYLPAMCRGELIGGQVMTEPESGSAAFNMQTQAVRDGDHYVLNGTKTFISNAPIGDVFVVYVRTDPELSAQKGISAFIVRKDMPGFVMSREWEKSGLRTAPMGEIVFQDCKVPADHVLGTEGKGYNVFQSTIEWERSFFFASQIGIMERILDQCVSYAKKRKQFGQPIGSFQSVSNKIVEMKMRLEMAKMMMYRVGWLKSEGRFAFMESSIVKLYVSEGLIQTCLDAIQLHGARGYMTEYELERELRDALAGTIYAGTSEMQRGIIASLLGL